MCMVMVDCTCLPCLQDSDDTPLVDVLDTCLKAEEIAASLDTVRMCLLCA